MIFASCVLSVENMRMSSIYTMTKHPLIMSEKILSIIAWKVAGELHRLKNITVGSNSPRLVLKAAFHWLPSRMRTLLYPHHTSNFVKYLAPLSLSRSSVIQGRGYAFLMVCSVSRSGLNDR